VALFPFALRVLFYFIIMNFISLTPCITIFMQKRYSLFATNCIVSDFTMKGTASFVFISTATVLDMSLYIVTMSISHRYFVGIVHACVDYITMVRGWMDCSVVYV